VEAVMQEHHQPFQVIMVEMELIIPEAVEVEDHPLMVRLQETVDLVDLVS
jgi:hypothetical protein